MTSTRRVSPESDEMSQSDRFKEAARELDADESDDALDRIMGKLDLTKKPEPKLEKAKED